jgi:hypothetical protein
MGTIVAAPSRTVRPDDIFFPAMAVLILVSVVTGFGQSYFLAGMIRRKLPNALVHIHGAILATWIAIILALPCGSLSTTSGPAAAFSAPPPSARR